MARTLRGPSGNAKESSPPVIDVSDTLVDAPAVPAPFRSAGDPLIGSVLGAKYKLIKPLAEGGMGTVYEAQHAALSRRFAVKVLSLESEKQADAVPRFKREAELASAIGHENIVDVVDIDHTEDGRWYIVMELLEGEELRDMMFRAKKLPLNEVVPIARQICAALDAAHSRGIVHRDLKPENIFVLRKEGGDLGVKILDFGISKVRDADQGLTRPGEVLGTPYYMAPEQARGDKTVDHRADLFALGAVMYEALSGDAPYRGDTPNQVLRSIILDTPRSPVEVNPDLPQEVSRVIMRALSKDPADRFQSGGAFVEALDAAAAPREVETPTPALQPEPNPPKAEAPPRNPQPPKAATGYGPKHLLIAFLLGAALCGVAIVLMRMF